MKSTELPPQNFYLRLPFATIATVLITLLVVKSLAVIAPLFLPLLIAAMLATSLAPLANWMTGRGLSRNVAVSLITMSLCLLACLFLAFILPKIYQQAQAFMESLPQLRKDILGRVEPGGAVQKFLEQNLHRELISPKAANIKQLLFAGNYVLGGLGELLLIFVLTVYLLFDGPRLVEWTKAYFTPTTQKKIEDSRAEVSKIVAAYVVGQGITSLLSFLYVFAALEILGVPNVLLLATLSGLLDVLPVLGFILAVVPAMFFSLEVSPLTPLIVLMLYLVYHTVENYLIVPYVYGKRLRVSSFVVFFSLLAAGLLAGIEGAAAVLPIIASFPILEHIWLKRYVRQEVLIEHDNQN